MDMAWNMAYGIWHGMELWPSVQGAGFLIQGSRVQNHWVAPRFKLMLNAMG